MAFLVALDGGLAGRRFPLETTFLVGRGPFNHAVLDDVRISRQHAKISHEVDGLVVYDLGSSNGTYVNDNAVKRHVLSGGDLVRFGPFRFRFEAEPVESGSGLGRRAPKQEELTRVGFEAPTKIVGETDGKVPKTFVTSGGLADLEEADRRLRTLFSFVHAIALTLESKALVDLIIDNLFEAFPTGTLAAVYVLDKDTDTMDAKRVRSRDGRDVPHYPLPAELHLEIVQRGKALLSTPLALDWDDGKGAGYALLMHAPMVYRGAVLGVLNVRCDFGSSFSQGDLDLLTALASHAALALKNTTLHQESLAQQRLQLDLSLAQQIQKSFLPLALPDVAGLRFLSEYRPAYSVGGDFYDVFWLGPDRIGCVIGDVSGKGVAAALLMARVSSDLRTAMLTAAGPAAALSRVNRDLVARGQHDIFVTAVALSIHVPTRTIILASAGHMPPYVRRTSADELIKIEEGTSSPLGLFADMPYQETSFTLQDGDTVVLTTDGVHEATNVSGEQLGVEGVERILKTGTSDPSSIAERLLTAVREHAESVPQYDDLTLLLCGTTG